MARNTEKTRVQLDALQAMDVDERAAILDAALDAVDEISRILLGDAPLATSTPAAVAAA